VNIKWGWPELLLALHEAVVDELVHAAGFLVRQARLQPLAKGQKVHRVKKYIHPVKMYNDHWIKEENRVKKSIGSENTSGQKIHRVKKYRVKKYIGSKNIGSKNTSGQKVHRVQKILFIGYLQKYTRDRAHRDKNQRRVTHWG
jgi:hypothetical protein